MTVVDMACPGRPGVMALPRQRIAALNEYSCRQRRGRAAWSPAQVGDSGGGATRLRLPPEVDSWIELSRTDYSSCIP